MTEKQKKERLKELYRQLDHCGQILAEWDEEEPPTSYKRDYKRILREIARLEPKEWDYPYFRKSDYTKRNEAVAEFCKSNHCGKCGGALKQTRSGSLSVVCVECGAKYQLKTKK